MTEPDELYEAEARALCISRGLNPDCLHQSMFDEPVDAYFSNGKPGHWGWRKQVPHVRAVLAAAGMAPRSGEDVGDGPFTGGEQ